ncbi:MAG: substrate-binding domain-containing protein [Granulosicoccus sp.]|nr:substrate-binding domain-containing protein [Granulosicoccus sp.]
MKVRPFLFAIGVTVATLISPLTIANGDNPFIILQSTTSTQNSGLLDAILPMFTIQSGIQVRVVAVGTGQAIRNARNGDGDVLLVHAKADEEKFVADGWGVQRFDVMYNDFVLVGPDTDPARISDEKNVIKALTRIAQTEAAFVSRGDDSGTHKAELRLWQEAAIDVQEYSGRWYRETGSGMGATLNVALGMSAYVLTDRATWIAFGNKGKHEILLQGEDQLFNQYGIIAVSSEVHPSVKAEEAQLFIEWLTGDAGQRAIAQYRVDGQQLFFPNAVKMQQSK